MRKRDLTKNIMVRLSERDFPEVVKLAQQRGLRPAEFGRELMIDAIKKRTHDAANPSELRAFFSEWGRQGNNINQIARRLNSVGAPEDVKAQIDCLLEIHRCLLAEIRRVGRRST